MNVRAPKWFTNTISLKVACWSLLNNKDCDVIYRNNSLKGRDLLYYEINIAGLWNLMKFHLMEIYPRYTFFLKESLQMKEDFFMKGFLSSYQ